MRRLHARLPASPPAIAHRRRWLAALVLLGVCGALAPAAGAASTSGLAGVTDATTGLPDASSVVALDACGAPTATRAACLAKVLGVRGTHSLVHPLLRPAASPNRLARPRARRAHSATALGIAAVGAPQPGTPAYLQQAYDLAYLSQTAGAGATVAIVDAFDAPHAEADLAAYRAKYSLPACPSANGCFTKLDQTGGTNYPGTTSPGWELETSLDLDAVSALCPNCHIVLVEAASDGVSDLSQAQAEAAQAVNAQQGAKAISDSWAVELTGRAAATSFASSGTYTFPGITTVAASGDDGYRGPSTNDFPAALGDVTAAGGTTLVPASSSGVQSPRDFTEYGWSGSGSGCASPVAKPAWQTDAACGGRSYNDLSANADPATGMQVYDSGNGGWLVVGGTSEAAPLIAAYYALLGSAAQGPSWAYANAASLNDPSSGSNGFCAQSIAYICSARAGYDGVTGVGSISGAVTAGAPGIGGPGPSGSYTQSTTPTGAQLQGGVYPNGSDTTYWWEYGTTTAYGQQTTPTDIGAGTTPVSVPGALTGLQPSTAYHYRLVAQNRFGTEYGYDFTLTTPASATSSSTQGSGPATGPSPTTSPPQTTGSPTTGSTPAPGASAASATPSQPALGALRVASASASAATVTASLATGGVAAGYAIDYGTTPALGNRIAGSLGPSATGLRGTLRNLAPGRTYYVRADVTNPAGSVSSTTIRFHTSPVTIARVTIRGGQLHVVLRCHGSAQCRVRFQLRAGSRLIAAGQSAIRGNRTAVISLALSRAFATALTSGGHGRRPGAKLSVLSSWNGYPAAVSAAI